MARWSGGIPRPCGSAESPRTIGGDLPDQYILQGSQLAHDEAHELGVYCWGDNPFGIIAPMGDATITTPTRIENLTRSAPAAP